MELKNSCHLLIISEFINIFLYNYRTCHLAGELISHLKRHQGLDYDISDKDILIVQIAALLHDIGHGPFSHLFENVIKRVTGKKWKVKDFIFDLIIFLNKKKLLILSMRKCRSKLSTKFIKI